MSDFRVSWAIDLEGEDFNNDPRAIAAYAEDVMLDDSRITDGIPNVFVVKNTTTGEETVVEL